MVIVAQSVNRNQETILLIAHQVALIHVQQVMVERLVGLVEIAGVSTQATIAQEEEVVVNFLQRQALAQQRILLFAKLESSTINSSMC